MKRRKFVFGFGTAVAAGTGVLGTSAFTSTSAARQLEVQTAGDNNALLRLKQLGSGQRSLEDGTPENVLFRFPALQERYQNPGLGLGTDSIYEFDRDANASNNPPPTEGLLRIENQGTQPVEVYSEDETDSELEIELYDVTDPDDTALRDEPPMLDVGDSIDVGFRIRTFGADVDTFNETLTIIADQPDE